MITTTFIIIIYTRRDTRNTHRSVFEIVEKRPCVCVSAHDRCEALGTKNTHLLTATKSCIRLIVLCRVVSCVPFLRPCLAATAVATQRMMTCFTRTPAHIHTNTNADTTSANAKFLPLCVSFSLFSSYSSLVSLLRAHTRSRSIEHFDAFFLLLKFHSPVRLHPLAE